jgi:hypothetical protein
MRSVEDIVSLLRQRQLAQGVMLGKMREIKEAYEGDVVIPLPELDQANRPAVANLLNQGLDQMSMRVASVMPDVWYPPLKPGIDKSERTARTRRLANLAWWTQGHMRIKMRRRARWLVGYGAAPVVIRPDPDKEIPMWHLRDPLTTYPGPCLDPDDMSPPDCIFSFTRSLAWCQRMYPELIQRIHLGDKPRGDSNVALVEYIDGEEIVLLAIGKQKPEYSSDDIVARDPAVELEREPHDLGICPVVIPGRIGLDRRMSQFEGMLGMYMLQARLAALEVIAVEKGVFPDTYLISRPNEIASFISGPYDGRSGMVNIIKGGDIREVNTNPGFQTNPTIDRLERGQRLTAGIPAEFGGESTTNVRTGRRGDSILSAVIDFPIQEAHELFSEALQAENRIAIKVDKLYFDRQKSFYLSTSGAKGRVDYSPSTDFESDVNFVTYAQAGVDLNNLIIGTGQRIGVGTMSKRTAQELDPLIDDPEQEHDRVIAEALEAAMLQSIQMQASQGAIAPSDLAVIMDLVKSDKMELAKAVEEAQRRAQERQANAGPPGAPEGPVPAGSPEAQVGLQAGPEGAAAPTEAVGPPPQSLQNLGQMLNSLRNSGTTPSINGAG